MRTICTWGILLVAIVIFSGCASNTVTYIPPHHQLAAAEFYEMTLSITPEKAQNRVIVAMESFSWLKRQGSTLTYSGNTLNASPYVNCGLVNYHYPISGETGQLVYASPEISFMDFDNRAWAKLQTNLDVIVNIKITPISGGSKVKLLIQYTLNRKHQRGVSSYPPEKNAPFQFSTLEQVSSADGITCSAKLTLEQKIIRAIAEE